jgi:2,5-diamino-6-(ribosylamino)-4(3H)-pyrimidinone 5'-phosphate reductase
VCVCIHLAMTSECKKGANSEAISRKDFLSGSRHEDRLARAAHFCKQIYGLPPCSSTKIQSSAYKPRVTLTYAQSKDGKIAGPEKKMVALSGEASMIMTHSLRTMHDGILVGIGTLLNDNPQLNARLLNPLQDNSQVSIRQLPRPIVLDSRVQTPLSCKLLANANAGTGKSPLIIAAKGHDPVKAEELRRAGAEVVEIETRGSMLPWTDVLCQISQAGIKSVMIEGGATVIESLFAAHQESPIIDEVIVTVAPIELGREGLGYNQPAWISKALDLPSTSRLSSTSSSSSPSSPSPSELRPFSIDPETFDMDSVFAWSSVSTCNEAHIKAAGQTMQEGGDY